MNEAPRDILNIEQAAELLGVSVKTFNKVLHSESIPARKIGREWKFSRRALIDWVGSGRSLDFYREAGPSQGGAAGNGAHDDVLEPMPRPRPGQAAAARRTSGWKLELD